MIKLTERECLLEGTPPSEVSLRQVEMFGMKLADTSIDAAAQDIVDRAIYRSGRKIYFVNAHCVNVASRNHNYFQELMGADRIYIDGAGMRFAALLLGHRLIDNVNGTDLAPRICERAAARGVPLALVGATPEVVVRCAQALRDRFGSLDLVYVRDGFFDESQTEVIAEAINRSGARIVLVARGVPKQEFFAARLSPLLPGIQIMAVGGLFDFVSGKRKRAPYFLRLMGLEWLVRLAQEPRRLFWRYAAGNVVFLGRTLLLRAVGRSALRSRVKLFPDWGRRKD